MTDHTFRATWQVQSSTEATDWATEQCRRYFGGTPYTVDVDVNEVRTYGGSVIGYRVGLVAEGMAIDHPAMSILRKIAMDGGFDYHYIDVSVDLSDAEHEYLNALTTDHPSPSDANAGTVRG